MTNSPLLIIRLKIQIRTCLVLFACKELLNDWFQLGTKVFAVEPAFEKNLGAAVNKIPGDDIGNDENEMKIAVTMTTATMAMAIVIIGLRTYLNFFFAPIISLILW